MRAELRYDGLVEFLQPKLVLLYDFAPLLTFWTHVRHKSEHKMLFVWGHLKSFENVAC